MNARIFAVEDDAPTLTALEKYIKKLGYEFVGKADSAEAALERITMVRPDLVLMDIELSGAMDGIELAARMQAESTAAVVYLTGHADAGTLARALVTEPYGYLVKPFTKQSLQASIELALYKSAVARRQQRIHDAMVQTITELVRIHDPYLDHVQTHAAELAEAIAVALKLSRPEVQGIRLAAMLHCIGLVGIPSAFTCYGEPLKGTQKALYQTHPEIAWKLLKDLEIPFPVAEMVYQHMERLDGSGFPRGLSGAAILPGACIVAVASEVARMMSARGLNPPAGVEEVVTALEQGRGMLFEGGAVDACVRLLRAKNFAVPTSTHSGETHA